MERRNVMSYGICRVQKMTAGSVKGIQIHDRREKNGVSHSNPDIDWSRTRQNYDVHFAQNKNFNAAVKKRIDQLNLKRAVRKDAIVMAQFLVTSDHDFFTQLSTTEQKQFFQDSYKFLANRFGIENVISATVHLDERTPHMHFNFVPVTSDGRLSAKSVLTRQGLVKLQDDFYLSVGKKYGLERGKRSDERREHLDTADFKARSLSQKIEQRQQELQKLAEKSRELASETAKAQKEVETLTAEKNRLQGQIEPIKEYFRTRDEIETLGKVKMGGKVLLTADEACKLKEQAVKLPLAIAQYQQAEQETVRLRTHLEKVLAVNEQLITENKQLTEEITPLRKLKKFCIEQLKYSDGTNVFDVFEDWIRKQKEYVQEHLGRSKQRNSSSQQRKKGTNL